LEEMTQRSSLREVTTIGARMMLWVAVEEEVTSYLQRDYYERSAEARGSRNGSNPRSVKVGCGDIEIMMPQVRDAAGPFDSLILPPRLTQMDELQQIIPLLYMHGLSTRKVKKAVGKLSNAGSLNVGGCTCVIKKDFSKTSRKRS
jgi:putative transposase